MNTFLDISGMVERTKQALNFKEDNELTSYLSVSHAILSSRYARSQIGFHLLLSKTRDIDLSWLLVGKDTPRHQTKLCKSGLTSGEVQMTHSPKTVGALDGRSITLYDIIATANLETLFINKRQYMVGKIQTPNIPLCDGVVYISGGSMHPILRSGDTVGFKEINSFGSPIYGEMYLVSFAIGGDGYLAVKYVNRSREERCLRLVSYNAHHNPVDIPFNTIDATAIVEFSIRRHMVTQPE